MKTRICLVLCTILACTSIFVSCRSNDNDNNMESTSNSNVESTTVNTTSSTAGGTTAATTGNDNIVDDMENIMTTIKDSIDRDDNNTTTATKD